LCVEKWYTLARHSSKQIDKKRRYGYNRAGAV
jgi:hypothetical protein